jgi:hypothetical protein
MTNATVIPTVKTELLGLESEVTANKIKNNSMAPETDESSMENEAVCILDPGGVVWLFIARRLLEEIPDRVELGWQQA